jgi:hypothetical protein
MKNKLLCAVAALWVVGASPALADTVCEWVDFSDKIITAAAPPAGTPRTPDHDRAGTHVSLAMFEALNAIDRRYESYVGMTAGDRTASQDAAAATAAYKVLLHHYPSQRTALDESYAIAMEAVTDARAREAGKTIGEEAATKALATGAIDAAIRPAQYRPRTRPGEWIGAQLPAFEPFTTTFRPWAIPNVEALRPPPPPALNSARWARDYDEVRRLGARNSTERTAHQTLMARYRITPNMAPTMRMVADAPGRRLVDNARMFALAGMAADDAGMAMAAAKLHYNYWRPITAIRNAAEDGNDATAPQDDWVPLINTPNHPEYPCGHCTFAGATAEVMQALTGNAPPGGVRVSSYSIPNAAVQALPSWNEWVQQVSNSRIYGGVHYRFSNEAGEQIGRRAARHVLERALKPLPRDQQRPAA